MDNIKDPCEIKLINMSNADIIEFYPSMYSENNIETDTTTVNESIEILPCNNNKIIQILPLVLRKRKLYEEALIKKEQENSSKNLDFNLQNQRNIV